jgi:hypothetical protein
MRIKIPVAELEFEENGNTIWVHSPKGCTVLRIHAEGRITATLCKDNAVSHVDISVPGSIQVCVHPDDLANAEGESGE